MNYLLRGIESAIWLKATKKAKEDGHTMKWLFLQWLRAYVNGK